MNIGLIGLPKSGKTTVFSALTGKEIDTSAYTGAKVEPHMAVVDVTDPRVDRLSAMYEPKSTIYATIELIDFPGMQEREGDAFAADSLNRIKSCDALAIVLRNFSEPSVDAEFGDANPAGEFESVYSELLLTDQIVAERRVEKLSEDRRKGRTPNNPREEKILGSVVESIDSGSTLRSLDIDDEARRVISGFQFLTAKPIFAVINSSDDRYASTEFSFDVPAIEFASRFESELAGLNSEEAGEFLLDAGIDESARARLTTFAYGILGYLSFFTVGEDEVRAWTIRQGSNSVVAAGAIHSDLARGFIRAEVFRSDDLFELGSEVGLKKAGKIRLEGKEYEVKDGDVINVRFSV